MVRFTHYAGARRMIYLDEDTWCIALADFYDADNNLTKTTENYFRCIPVAARNDLSGLRLLEFRCREMDSNRRQKLPALRRRGVFRPAESRIL
jgi:hypothetical protein